MRDSFTLYAQEIKQAVDMRRALEHYGIAVNSAGYALCPFHDENTASLKVYNKSFYCFGCGKGGDVIRFVRDLFGISFREAVEKLNADFTLGLPIGQRLTVRQARDMKQRQAQRLRTRSDEAEQKAQRFSEYLDLLQEEDHLRFVMEMCSPLEGEETPPAEWVNASRRLGYVGYLLDHFYLQENAESIAGKADNAA